MALGDIYSKKKRWGSWLSAADSDRLAGNSNVKGSGNAERPVSDIHQVSVVNPPSMDSHNNCDNEYHSSDL
ncbi:hypothetical protein DITRI_Ditri09bG0153000 [Diplodiscus trichospermus]